ncbi:response regulator [Streptomyces sp. NPDC048337]|uniref:response regulator n=1 Tax=Streptomyces sp. NPDC048337 TaxID=3365535 RepID=UPI00371E3076
MTIRVLLADDEAMIRGGVRAILESAEDVEVVAEAGDGREAVDLAARHRPDVVLMDIRMPRMDGLTAAAEVRRLVPGTAVVMLTTFSEDKYIVDALAGEVSGFLLKSGDPQDLLTAVRAVRDGASFLSPQIAHRVMRLLGARDVGRGMAAQERVAALSGREREVLALLGAGCSNAEIARRLFVVEGTVKAYVSAILTRLEVKNRVQAAIVAHEAGLVPQV